MLPGDVTAFGDDLLDLPGFKPMSEHDWFLSDPPTPHRPLDQSSCSQSPAFHLLGSDPLFDFSCESSFGDGYLDFGGVEPSGPAGSSQLGLPESIPEDPLEVPALPTSPGPLESCPPEGAPPTLFLERPALRRPRGGDEEGVSCDGSAGDCEAEEGKGKGKGKRKAVPAKNLLAERRRRKKLNDRLYMLRSVVPKISKMDRASILGDAVEYLKELVRKINDLHNELESGPSSGSLVPSTGNGDSFQPLVPMFPTLPSRVKGELSLSPITSPRNQEARIEVGESEGRAVNIHMFCGRRPGLLLSTMRALDSMGLDIQQAAISCFNGFALDIFRAEQCKDGSRLQPEEIKAVLLHSAGLQGAML